jgi:hypothetical protein
MNATKQHSMKWIAAKFFALVSVLGCAATSPARADVVFSFEDGLQGWSSPDGYNVSQSAFGATHGDYALVLSGITSGFKNLVTTNNFGPTHPELADAFSAFALAANVASAGGAPRLEFDFSYDMSAVTNPNWIQLGINVNSSTAGGGGFHQYGVSAFLNGNLGSDWPFVAPGDATTDGVTLTPLGSSSYRVSVPIGPDKRLKLSNESTFYYLRFQTNGGWDGTVDFAFDNFRFTGVPRFTEHTLFSWETPDDPNTPINEQFEGWGPGLHPGHQLSITNTGATDGNYALQIDATGMTGNFSWGSRYQITSDIDPDPQNQVIDPVIQAHIDDLVTRINGAARLEFDVTYQDQFPLNPSWTQFYVYFADDTGAFYQAGTSSFNINNAPPGTRRTLSIDIDSFVDSSDPESTKTLAVDGLALGTTSLAIGLGTSTDDGAVYQIDNFRLITQVPEFSADFNNDGVVDGGDLAIWEGAYGATATADADGDGFSDGHDFLVWQREYGLGMASNLAATVAVPEPATALLMCLCGVLAISSRRRVA